MFKPVLPFVYCCNPVPTALVFNCYSYVVRSHHLALHVCACFSLLPYVALLLYEGLTLSTFAMFHFLFFFEHLFLYTALQPHRHFSSVIKLGGDVVLYYLNDIFLYCFAVVDCFIIKVYIKY